MSALATSWSTSIPAESLQAVMTAGYLAAGHGRFADARRIFAGLVAVRPQSELPWIGLAITEVNAGNSDAALAALKQAESRNVNSDLVKGFRAMVLRLSGDDAKCDAIINDLAENGKEESMIRLAAALANHRSSD